jgi:hypothetical protein
VFNATVLQPWPVPDPSSIVVINPRPASDEHYGPLSSLEYRYFRERASNRRSHSEAIDHVLAQFADGCDPEESLIAPDGHPRP